MNKPVSSQSSTPASVPSSTHLRPAWRAAGYTSTLLGVVCMMVAAGALGDGDPKNPPSSSHRAAGWVGLGGSALFLTTGFRLLRERSEESR